MALELVLVVVEAPLVVLALAMLSFRFYCLVTNSTYCIGLYATWLIKQLSWIVPWRATFLCLKLVLGKYQLINCDGDRGTPRDKWASHRFYNNDGLNVDLVRRHPNELSQWEFLKPSSLWTFFQFRGKDSLWTFAQVIDTIPSKNVSLLLW